MHKEGFLRRKLTYQLTPSASTQANLYSFTLSISWRHPATHCTYWELCKRQTSSCRRKKNIQKTSLWFGNIRRLMSREHMDRSKRCITVMSQTWGSAHAADQKHINTCQRQHHSGERVHHTWAEQCQVELEWRKLTGGKRSCYSVNWKEGRVESKRPAAAVQTEEQ